MTFSLAARCATTGMLGAVITTSSPAVGSRCIFTSARTGVVLTQFWTDPRLGPRGLALLAEGCPPDAVVAALAASTADRDWRQIAVIAPHGKPAHFTGAHTKPALAAATGSNSVAIGNILRNDTVPAAMVDAFESSGHLPFPERLLLALEAGQAAGGEERALVSAALLVSHTEAFPYVDLRVDAASDPLGELRSLWKLYAPLADEYVTRALTPAVLAP